MDKQLAEKLGQVARAARLRAGLTQADVAERLGVATEVYGRLERGLMLPSVETLTRLCKVLVEEKPITELDHFRGRSRSTQALEPSRRSPRSGA